MFKLFKTIIILSILTLLIGWLYYSRAVNTPLSAEEKKTVFTVTSGEGVRKIASNLSNAGLIRSEAVFLWHAKRGGLDKKFQAGEYELSASQSIADIAEILSSGETLNREKTIKIIEGWSIKDIDAYLVKNGITDPDAFSRLAGKKIGDLEELKIPEILQDKTLANATLEGSLYPDTYRIFENSGEKEIIEKMLANFDKKLNDEMRAEIAKQGKPLSEIITMASLVEKEVKIDATGKTENKDARIVSGIFWTRIKQGQRLESCATLAYILGVNKPQYSYEDTQIKSPYNTYQNAGLPPGPISNPGIEAIKAAVFPIDTDYIFFLNDPKTGNAIFSRNYDEHLRNKAKYLD